MAFGDHFETERIRKLVNAALKEANIYFKEADEIRIKAKKIKVFGQLNLRISDEDAAAATKKTDKGYALISNKLKEIADSCKKNNKNYRWGS